MKQLLLSIHNYHDAHRSLPPVAQPLENAAEGKAGLSWRVLLLPYLEEGELYEQFRLDEPWDSVHNAALIDRMPDIYRSVDAEVPAGKTVFVRPIFAKSMAEVSPPRFAAVTDGLSNTILIAEAAPASAVVWTQPDDLPIDLERFREQLGDPDASSFLVGMGDGSILSLPKVVPAETFRRLIQATDGEPIDREALKE